MVLETLPERDRLITSNDSPEPGETGGGAPPILDDGKKGGGGGAPGKREGGPPFLDNWKKAKGVTPLSLEGTRGVISDILGPFFKPSDFPAKSGAKAPVAPTA